MRLVFELVHRRTDRFIVISTLLQPLIELLAAGCFASFGSHPDDLGPAYFASNNGQLPSTSVMPPSHSPSSSRNGRMANIDSILSYYSKSLTSLVSCTDNESPSGFDAFTQLASPSTERGEPARALHIAILAWAGRHLVNKGNFRFESVSETYGLQAMALMESLLSQRGKPSFLPETETEQITLLAGCLMVMQYKVNGREGRIRESSVAEPRLHAFARYVAVTFGGIECSLITSAISGVPYSRTTRQNRSLARCISISSR